MENVTKLAEISRLLTEDKMNLPNFTDEFFKTTETEKNRWKDNKIFWGFILLIALSAFVFYKCFGFLSDKQFPSGYLLFFFGVIAILFIGLVVLASFMIKASAKYRTEKNERKNKMLAFRLKMLESAFELDNRKIFSEKHSIEKALSMNEKEFLYSLDKKQREDEHNRKIQLKQYEIIEDYMKHMVESAKTGQQKFGDIDLQMIISIFNNEKQPAQDGDETKKKVTEGEGGHGRKTEEDKPGQQAEPTLEKGNLIQQRKTQEKKQTGSSGPQKSKPITKNLKNV